MKMMTMMRRLRICLHNCAAVVLFSKVLQEFTVSQIFVTSIVCALNMSYSYTAICGLRSRNAICLSDMMSSWWGNHVSVLGRLSETHILTYSPFHSYFFLLISFRKHIHFLKKYSFIIKISCHNYIYITSLNTIPH